MKYRIVLVICFAVSLSSHSQTEWFVYFSSGLGFGGPMASIRENMEKSNLNHKANTFDFFGASHRDVQYPVRYRGIPVLMKVGKKIKENKSVYVEVGVSNHGEIKGHQNIMGNYSNTIPIRFKVLQFTTGYQYSFPKTTSKIGVGPTLYVFNYKHGYKHTGMNNHASIVPGVSFMVRTPIGREKSHIGVDLMLEGNIAPPARMKEISKSNILAPQYTSVLKAGKVNMIHGMIGFALSYKD